MVELCEYGEESDDQREQVVYNTYSNSLQVEALYICARKSRLMVHTTGGREKEDNPLLMTAETTKE